MIVLLRKVKYFICLVLPITGDYSSTDSGIILS
jgi:hypothetical protein